MTLSLPVDGSTPCPCRGCDLPFRNNPPLPPTILNALKAGLAEGNCTEPFSIKKVTLMTKKPVRYCEFEEQQQEPQVSWYKLQIQFAGLGKRTVEIPALAACTEEEIYNQIKEEAFLTLHEKLELTYPYKFIDQKEIHFQSIHKTIFTENKLNCVDQGYLSDSIPVKEGSCPITHGFRLNYRYLGELYSLNTEDGMTFLSPNLPVFVYPIELIEAIVSKIEDDLHESINSADLKIVRAEMKEVNLHCPDEFAHDVHTWLVSPKDRVYRIHADYNQHVYRFDFLEETNELIHFSKACADKQIAPPIAKSYGWCALQ